MVASVRGQLPALEAVIYLNTPGWASLLEAGDAVSRAALKDRMGQLSPADAINIHYNSGTTGFLKEQLSLTATFSMMGISSESCMATRISIVRVYRCPSITASGW